MFSETLPKSATSSFSLTLCKDSLKDEQFLVFDKVIAKYAAIREDRYIWKIHLGMQTLCICSFMGLILYDLQIWSSSTGHSKEPEQKIRSV